MLSWAQCSLWTRREKKIWKKKKISLVTVMFLLQNICLMLHSKLLVCLEPCTHTWQLWDPMSPLLPKAAFCPHGSVMLSCPLFSTSGQLGKAYGSSGNKVGILHSQAVLQWNPIMDRVFPGNADQFIQPTKKTYQLVPYYVVCTVSSTIKPYIY